MEQQNQQPNQQEGTNDKRVSPDQNSKSGENSVWVKMVPNILIVLGIFTFVLSISLFSFVFPRISETYTDPGVESKASFTFILLVFVMLFSIFQTAMGFFVKKKRKTENFLLRNHIVLQIVSLCVNIFIIPLIIGFAIVSIISPLYDLTSQVPEDKQRNDILAGWQTYRNDEFGFEVRYPIKWFLQEIRSSVFFSPFQVYSMGKIIRESVRVDIIDLNNIPPPPPVTSLGSREYWESIYNDFGIIRRVQSAHYGELSVKEPHSGDVLYLARIVEGERAAVFSFGKDVDRKYDYVFDQILATFRFVEE